MKRTYIFIALLVGLCAGFSQASFGQSLYNIESATGWQTCSSCAGAGGSGPSVPHSLTRYISSPSLDGDSTKFWIGGSTPYGNAYWWKDLSGTSATHFQYDTYFYLKTPSAAQALEFDINQMINGKWYIFGTECVLAGTPHWDIYDPYARNWVTTSVPCAMPRAYTWNHLTLEFQRYNGMNKFISVTVNGVKHYFSGSYRPRSASSYKTTIAFQMDEKGSATDYSVWLDKLSMKAW
jgi:hypothetical protein